MQLKCGTGANSVLPQIKRSDIFDIHVMQFGRCKCYQKLRSLSHNFLRDISDFPPHTLFDIGGISYKRCT